jgi:predicted short-subunit dehydrogenase-like oxidoreductase (DUF2520 family)
MTDRSSYSQKKQSENCISIHRSHAFIGPGRVANTLAAAMRAAGETVAGYVANPNAAHPFQPAQSLGFQGLGPLDTAALKAVDWVWVTVADDRIDSVSRYIDWQPHQVALHCSGATELSHLHAHKASAAIGFHPLQIFSQPAIALQLLAGSSVGIEVVAHQPHILETDAWQLASQLASTVQLKPLRIASGQRALYHAGAGYAASALVSMLSEASHLWQQVGIDPEQAREALLPLSHGALQAMRHNGLADAVAGPIARGDAGVVRQHMHALQLIGPSATQLYQQVALRQLNLLATAERLSAEQARDLSLALRLKPDHTPP